ncbi:putative alpha/Beta hydrolase [Helianthus debilis subsp. tardiflorus]
MLSICPYLRHLNITGNSSRCIPLLHSCTRNISGIFMKFLLMFFTALLAWAYQAACPPAPNKVGPPDGLPITTPRIKLRDGRYLSYKEFGVPKDLAKYKIIFVHGFDCVKHYAVIATSASPSDPDPKRTLKSLALDTEELADQLELGSKFYVVGYSMGGKAIWSYLKYIPHRYEQVRQQGEYESLHHDLNIGFGTWEFDPTEIENPFPENEGSVHIWQGDEYIIYSYVPIKVNGNNKQSQPLDQIEIKSCPS